MAGAATGSGPVLFAAIPVDAVAAVAAGLAGEGVGVARVVAGLDEAGELFLDALGLGIARVGPRWRDGLRVEAGDRQETGGGAPDDAF